MGVEQNWEVLEIGAVSKRFRDPKGSTVQALNEVSLKVTAGEFVVLLGPSGCGKTTLLRAIAGFEKLDSGFINLNGTRIDVLPPHLRPVNTVFQSYALFPHLTVKENIAFGLENEKLSKEEISERVNSVLDLVELTELGERKPAQMSGGQQQRAALARALAKKPKVLLLDEPLAALDLKLRKTMQAELKRIHRATGTTFIFVTHDQNEAMALGDRIAVFNKGVLQQIGTPHEIYTNPGSEFVADFIGESSIIVGSVQSGTFKGKGIHIENLPSKFTNNSSTKILIRPEAVAVLEGSNASGTCSVIEVLFSGDAIELILETSEGQRIKSKNPPTFLGKIQVGQSVEIFVDPNQIGLMS